MASGPKTYTGAIHVHTDQSDGEGTLEEVLEAARRCSLDFVILTDHDTRGYAEEEMEGWRGDVLVLCGEEVTTPEGHLLAFETHSAVGAAESLSDAVDAIGKQSGVAVSIHHQLVPMLAEQEPPLKALALDQAAVVEIWSFMDDFLVNSTPDSIGRRVPGAAATIRGPSRKLLWEWDRELQRRPVPVVGGVNVHRRKSPLLDWRAFFPYEAAFNTVCTAIQVQRLPKHDKRACDLVWNALREGRSYIVDRSTGPEKGFEFQYHPPAGRARRMGETTAYSPGGRFSVRTPAEAEVVLRHNGQPLFWGTTQEMTFPPASPGSYRVEVYLNRRLWILSNAIRLIDEEGIVQPTVSDVT